MTEVVVARDAELASQLAAELIIGRVQKNELRTLGVATGSSPVALYRQLGRLAEQLDVSLERLRAFALDEYVGLPEHHPQSFKAFLLEHFVAPLGVDPHSLRVPSGSAADLEAEGAAFEKDISDAGGIDLQILGIGSNGHIGFNEPGSSLASRTRVKTLAPSTRDDNAPFFDSPDEVPHHCISQGIGTILEAKTLAMLAFGSKKADAVARAIEGPVTSSCPGSAIQLHPQAIVFLDEEAAAGLKHLDYYRFVWVNKPQWQSWRTGSTLV